MLVYLLPHRLNLICLIDLIAMRYLTFMIFSFLMSFILGQGIWSATSRFRGLQVLPG